MHTWGIPGPVFLVCYAAALAALAGLVAVRRRRLDSDADDDYELDRYEAALLTGGEQLVITTALAALRQRGVVVAADDTLRDLNTRNVVRLDRLDDRRIRNLGVAQTLVLAGPVPFGLHPVEAAAAAAVGPAASDVHQVRRQLLAAPALSQLRGRLEVAGLVRGSAERSALRSSWPLAAVLAAVGVTRFLVGASRGRPVGYLGLLVVAAFALLFWVVLVPKMTRRAGAALARLRTKHPELSGSRWPQQAPVADPALAAALFGAGALWAADPALAWALAVPRKVTAAAAGTSSAGCGSAGGGSCGGGSGGGCGGCGG